MRTFVSTETKEDYLRAIFKLQERGEKSTRLTDLAHFLSLSKSTVSERIQELTEQGFVNHSPYSQLTFTRRGYTLARKITSKHRLLEVFLNRTLKIPKNKVHAEAHKLEHAISDSVAKRLGKFLGNPKVDPHGMLISSF